MKAKAIRKFLLCSPLLVIAPTMTVLVSCNNETHEHEYSDKYDIDDKGHLFHVCDLCGEKISATDEEIDALENKILVKENGIYKPSDLTLKEILNTVPAEGTIDLVFVKGSYKLEDPANEITANIYGVVHSDGTNQVQIPVIQDAQVPQEYHHLNLNLYHADMIGATIAGTYYMQTVGLEIPTMNCFNCHLIGYQSVWTSESATFDNCLFDTSMMDLAPDSTEYSLCTWSNPPEITIKNSTFYGQGKCFKVYSEKATSTLITLENCIFKVNKEDQRQKKYAIEIYTGDVGGPWGDNKWTIKINNCSMEDPNNFKGLYTPNEPHTEVIEIKN